MMKNNTFKKIIKLVPVFSIGFLMSCAESGTEAESLKVDQSNVELSADSHQGLTTAKNEENNEQFETISSVDSLVSDEVLEEDTLQEDNTKVVELKTDIEENIESQVEERSTPNFVSEFNHSSWNTLLQKHVSTAGKVDYKGFKSDKFKLDDYLTLLKSNSPKSDWTKNQKLAYWINVYNAFTVKLIVDNYPLKSITNLEKPWDKKWIKIDGKTYSLGNVENDILRKMGESRIHFAINCASVSCPKLLNKAFVADDLNSQLRKVTKEFFNDESKNMITNEELKVSKLFEWYAQDFSNGDIIAYINNYSGKKVEEGSDISFLEYDWNLNE